MYDESRVYDTKWQLAIESQVRKVKRETTIKVQRETAISEIKKIDAQYEKEMAAKLKRTIIKLSLRKRWVSVENLVEALGISKEYVIEIRDSKGTD